MVSVNPPASSCCQCQRRLKVNPLATGDMDPLWRRPTSPTSTACVALTDPTTFTRPMQEACVIAVACSFSALGGYPVRVRVPPQRGPLPGVHQRQHLHLAAADSGPVRLPVRLAGAQSLRQPVPRVGERPEDAERFVAERHDASGAGVAYLSLEPVTVPCDGFRDECCGRGPSRKIVRVQAGGGGGERVVALPHGLAAEAGKLWDGAGV